MAKQNFHDWCPVMTLAVSFKKASRSHENILGNQNRKWASFSPKLAI